MVSTCVTRGMAKVVGPRNLRFGDLGSASGVSEGLATGAFPAEFGDVTTTDVSKREVMCGSLQPGPIERKMGQCSRGGEREREMCMGIISREP